MFTFIQITKIFDVLLQERIELFINEGPVLPWLITDEICNVKARAVKWLVFHKQEYCKMIILITEALIMVQTIWKLVWWEKVDIEIHWHYYFFFRAAKWLKIDIISQKTVNFQSQINLVGLNEYINETWFFSSWIIKFDFVGSLIFIQDRKMIGF